MANPRTASGTAGRPARREIDQAQHDQRRFAIPFHPAQRAAKSFVLYPRLGNAPNARRTFRPVTKTLWACWGRTVDKKIRSTLPFFSPTNLNSSSCLHQLLIPRFCSPHIPCLRRWIPESPLHLPSHPPEATSRHLETGQREHQGRLPEVPSGARRALVPRVL
jgi:hypothetical protein